MKTANRPNTREHFRLKYPPYQEPILVINREQYVIKDISEKGVKFNIHGIKHNIDIFLELREEIKGTIDFKGRGSFNIKGKIVRINERIKIAVIKLDNPIPLSQIMAEQRFLIQNYPDYAKKQ
jgi:hypothetical protein